MVYPSIYETFILQTPYIPNADIATARFNHSSPHLSYNTLCLRALAALALQRSATGDRLLQPPPTPRPATSLAGAALADGPGGRWRLEGSSSRRWNWSLLARW